MSLVSDSIHGYMKEPKFIGIVEVCLYFRKERCRFGLVRIEALPKTVQDYVEGSFGEQLCIASN